MNQHKVISKNGKEYYNYYQKKSGDKYDFAKHCLRAGYTATQVLDICKRKGVKISYNTILKLKKNL